MRKTYRTMVSKRLLKTIKSLGERRSRLREGLFVAEGPKLVGELLPSFPLRCVVAVEEWLRDWGHLVPGDAECETVPYDELTRASLQQHPQDVIALFGLPRWEASVASTAGVELTLALDVVQDPGNLGTIVRLADWFGVEYVFCSHGSADIFNPKAVQATMGALGRVKVIYTDLEAELGRFPGKVYGTFLGGQSLYEAELSQSGVILLGNEGKGISPRLAGMVSTPLFVPPYPAGRRAVESLNVAMAAAIVCAEFRRRGLTPPLL